MAEATITGEVEQFEEPAWDPLLHLLGDALVADFMWMHEVRMGNGEAVHAYKHRWTRRYIHLSESGAGYAYVGEAEYRRLPTLELAARALRPEDWPGAGRI